MEMVESGVHKPPACPLPHARLAVRGPTGAELLQRLGSLDWWPCRAWVQELFAALVRTPGKSLALTLGFGSVAAQPRRPRVGTRDLPGVRRNVPGRN
jgi:hypothetical protein